MDQILDTFGIRFEVLTAQIVNFALLMALLWYFLYRPLLTLIEKRRAQIIEGVAQAEQAEASLRDAATKRSDILAAAGLEAEELVKNARSAAKVREDSIVALAEEKAQRIVGEAELRAESVKRESIESVREDLARMIVLGAEKILRERNTA